MKRLVPVLLAVLIAGTAHAATIRVPSDQSTVQGGINASSPGDTVLVAPGTYKENINIGVDSLVLASLYLVTGDTSYVNITVLDGNSAGSVVQCESRVRRITGFTIRNGKAPRGGGILFIGSGLVCRVDHNFILSNVADTVGGGICCNWYAGSTPDTGIIESNVFSENRAMFDAAGFVMSEGNVLFRSNRLINNAALESGGGIRFYGNGRVDCSRNLFDGNSARLYGAIRFNSASGAIDSCAFANNRAASKIVGIGDHNQVAVRNSSFEGNTADCVIEINSIHNLEATIENCVMLNNTAGVCIQIAGDSCSLSVRSCTITCNSGHGIAFGWGQHVERRIVGCILASNGYYGITADASVQEENISLSCSDVFGNSIGDWDEITAKMITEDKCLRLNPLLRGATSLDLALDCASPCLPNNASNPCKTLIGASGPSCSTGNAHCCHCMRGNVNMVSIVDLSDLSALVSFLAGGDYVLPCVDAANVNGTGIVDLSDLSALVSYLTGGGYVLPSCPQRVKLTMGNLLTE
jgi:hypothetical protein